MDKKINLWMKITKSSKCIDKKNDIWLFYCPYCKKWYQGFRHGYTSEFYSQMYFECDKGHKIEALWWK